MRAVVVLFGVVSVTAFAALAGAGTADSAPIQGAQLVQFSSTNDESIPVNLLVSPQGAPVPTSLPTAACPLDLGRRAGVHLTESVHGWESAASDFGTRDVSLHAEVHGTMADANGNVFRVVGSFDESGTTPFPEFEVAFDGSGHITMTGPSGTLSGNADFVDVTEGPPEWDVYFTSIEVCKIR
jgi:hypothetical protein